MTTYELGVPVEDLKAIYESYFEPVMPEEVFLGLTAEERSYGLAILSEAGARGNIGSKLIPDEIIDAGFDDDFQNNRALPWLLLATPWKYSLFSYGSEKLALELFQWDAEHLDASRARTRAGDRSELLFDQQLSALGGMLSNKNLSYTSAKSIIASVEAMWPARYGGGAEAYGELLDHVLWDQWVPTGFSAGPLQALGEYFASLKLPTIAKKYSARGIANAKAEWYSE